MTFQPAQARAQIAALVEEFYRLTPAQRESVTEAGVVNQFITPFLKALGWPVGDTQRYRYELMTFAGRPDITLFPEKGDPIYVEAKRFGVIKQLEVARRMISGIVTPGQMALPGMATDRTKEEQQAINYAFENGGAWAILTNFEKLRLFNARRDWLVLSFEDPRAYLEQFEVLEQLAYDNLCQGGLDALSLQRYREDVDSDYLNFINEWREKLAQDIVTHPLANPWAFDSAGVRLEDLRAVVQRILDRLVVVRFAEDHLVIPGGTLYGMYELNRQNPYTFSLSAFFQQLYRRFDETHNSALFALGLADQAVFNDTVLAGLIEKLYEARYRAMSADIMGNTYEQYLGKTLVRVNNHVQTADNLETRKKQGSYYTQQVIVRYLVDQSLGHYLYGTANGQHDGEPVAGETRKTAADIQELRCLDPSCGSGSFLIYAYQVLADFYRREIARLTQEINAELDALTGGPASPMAQLDLQIKLAPVRAEIARLQDYPRIILETHLYGVDLDPQAAEIATVNLIMRGMADQRNTKKRLPLILNQNIKVGNSLIGAGADAARYADHAEALAELRSLRLKLATGQNGEQHQGDLDTLAEKTAQLNATLNAGLKPYLADVDAQHPFNWAAEFPEVFVDEQGRFREDAGFVIIVGNPPWEIVKPDLREYYAQFDAEIESKLTRVQAENRIAELAATDYKLQAGWEAQKARVEATAAYYRRAPDYTRQGQGDTATHKLFLERAYGLLKDRGALGFVVPSGIYSDLGTKELREMLLNEGRIQYLYSFSNERFFFKGVDHRFKFVLLGAQKGETRDSFLATFRFNPRVAVAPDDLPEFLANESNLICVRRESLARFSPDSLSVMEFHTRQDYNVAEKIYSNWPLIGEDIPGIWQPRLAQEFHMSGDSDLFYQEQIGLPLYEGKMIHQFDAFFAAPRFWIDESRGNERLMGKGEVANWHKGYRFTFRAIARATDERTCIATILPTNNFTGHSLWVGATPDLKITLYFVALFNSFCVDWLTRFKIASNVTLFVIKQLPLPRLTPGTPYFNAIVPRAARLTCTTADFADLWQTVMGEPWDTAKGATAQADRQRLRDELDALVAHLYGLSREDFAHILGAFPLVFPDDEAGEKKKATLLAAYDAFAGVFG